MLIAFAGTKMHGALVVAKAPRIATSDDFISSMFSRQT